MTATDESQPRDLGDAVSLLMPRGNRDLLAPAEARPKRTLFCLKLQNPLRRAAIRIVENHYFEGLIITTIILNVLALCLYQPRPAGVTTERNEVLELIEFAFVAIFTAECVLKITAYGFVMHRNAYLRSPWNVLDFVIVVLGIISVIVETLNVSFVDVKALRAFRVLRPLRLISGLPQLQVVVNSIVKSLPHLYNIFVLFFFLITIFALVGLEFFKGILQTHCLFYGPYGNETGAVAVPDEDTCSVFSSGGYHCKAPFQFCATGQEGPNFGITSYDNIGLSMLTVFTAITLEGWTDVLYWTQDAISDWVWIFYVTLVVCGAFFILNLVLGVLSGEFSRQRERMESRGRRIAAERRARMRQDMHHYLEWMTFGDLVDPSVDRMRQRRASAFDGPADADAANGDVITTTVAESITQQRTRSSGTSDDIEIEMVPVSRSGLNQGGAHHHAPHYRNEQGVLTYDSDTDSNASYNTAAEDMDFDDDDEEAQARHGRFGEAISESVVNDEMVRHPRLARIVKSKPFYWTVMSLVLANTVILCAEHAGQSESFTRFLENANNVFTVLFVIDMLFKVCALGFRRYFLSMFNRFDFVVVIASVVEMLLNIVAGTDRIGISVLRSVRLLRLLKFTPYWARLRELTIALTKSLSSILSLVLLVLLLLVVFALLGMQLFGARFDFPEGTPRSNFDNFWNAFVTVFQMLTGEDWNAVMYDGIRAYGGVGSLGVLISLYFVIFVVIGLFILLNVFLAIAVDGLQKDVSETDTDTGEDDEDNEDDVLAAERDTAILAQLQQNTRRKSVSTHESDHDSVDRDKSLLETSEGIELADLSEINLAHEAKLLNVGEAELQALRDRARVKDATGELEANLHEEEKAADGTMGELPPSEPNVFDQWRARIEMHRRLPQFSSLWLLSPKSRIRKLIFRLISKKTFDNFILFCIICSSALLAAEDPVNKDAPRNTVLNYFDFCFTSIFATEMVMKIVALGLVLHKGAYARSGWNVLDAVVVIASIASLALSGSNISFIRVLRVVRVIRPLRAIHRADGLKAVVSCMVLSVRAIGNLMLISMFFEFIFAVVGVQLWKGAFGRCNDDTVSFVDECVGNFTVSVNVTEVLPPYYNTTLGLETMNVSRVWFNEPLNFDNVYRAMLTLYVVMTYEGWLNVMYNAVDAVGDGIAMQINHNVMAPVFFIIYIVLLSFFMVNLFVGFVVLAFRQQGEAAFKDCALNRNERACVLAALYAAPTPARVPSGEFRGVFFRFVESIIFEYFIMACILLNVIALMMAYFEMPESYADALDIVNYLFTGIFTLEALLKMIAYGLYGYFRDPWNVFDFVVVLGSIIDSALGGGVGVNVFRLFRILRLVRLIKRDGGLRELVWTFARSFKALPNVALFIGMLFFIYAVAGMQIFGRLSQSDTCAINRHANFATFPVSLLLLVRCATGENWQQLMLACADANRVECPCDPSDIDGSTCGNWFAYPFFVSFVLLCGFLVLNLFVAVILDNFDYLTRDPSELGPHHMDAFITTWSYYDPFATGKISRNDLVMVLRQISPPLGLGMYCPRRTVMKNLRKMDLPMNADKTIGFNVALLGLVRLSFKIEMDDIELALTFKKIWKRLPLRILSRALMLSEEEAAITTGKYYAALMLVEWYRRFKMRKEIREQLRMVHTEDEKAKLLARLRVKYRERLPTDLNYDEEPESV